MQGSSEKLLLIDALNIVRRVYEAGSGDDSPDKVIIALKNSRASFRRALSEHQPTHALAVFDHGGETWHHRVYPGYKSSRKPMYPQLRASLPAFRDQLLRVFGLASVAVPDVEADDVIATTACRWKGRSNSRCTVLSTDKDLLQLLTLGVDIHDHFEHERRDDEWLRDRLKIEPSQVCDYLALVGDRSDDIPGVEGIGPKTAVKLLADFGGLQKLLQSAKEVGGAVGKKLESQAEAALLSFQLVTLKRDVVVGLNWNSLRIAPLP